MTKFAATSINYKTPSKSVSPEPLDRFEETLYVDWGLLLFIGDLGGPWPILRQCQILLFMIFRRKT